MNKRQKSVRKTYFFTGILKIIIISVMNFLEPLKGRISKKGYLLENFKGFPIVDKSNIRNSVVRMIAHFFSLKDLKNEINSYLINPKLDQIRILKSPKISFNKQSEWHHDSVGHRIKVYIGLDEKVSDLVYTELIPHTQNNMYFDYNNTRIIPTEEELRIKREKVSLAHGDVFIFDTNMLHRANYSKVMSRNVIELEFSSYIRGKIIPGKVGRKKGKRPNNLLDDKEFMNHLNKVKNL